MQPKNSVTSDNISRKGKTVSSNSTCTENSWNYPWIYENNILKMSTGEIMTDCQYARSIHSHARKNKSVASNSLTDCRIQTSRRTRLNTAHSFGSIITRPPKINTKAAWTPNERGTTRAMPQNDSFANNKTENMRIAYLKGSPRSRAREMIELI